ncbi:GspH/FimT family pseudopilin [Methyloradius palustris]|uniref:Type II secretion system protein H n=1 Tax=Methyloradius palustris TaxID=2778876 RepID=A0A8D5G1C6_9PROT|nr:GspH/FimT family pseudopilin [Methyloradius palustris]BCM26149.1 general secretion pathway protein GspH [Methyloradius palustris]
MSTHSKGFSLIEIAITLAVLGILIASGIPSLRLWIQSTQVRTAAESIQNGLQLARAEAVRRNANVRFQLTTSIDASCAISNSGTNWVVSLGSPVSACASFVTDTSSTGVIQAWSNKDGASNAEVSSTTASTIIFNGLGRQVSSGTDASGNAIPVAPIVISVINSKGGACTTASVDGIRCMNVAVSTGGNIRMCDPALNSSDPQGC